MTIKFTPSSPFDERDTKRTLNEIYARLGAESREDDLKAMIDKIIRDFKEAKQRAEISLGLAGGRGAKRDLDKLHKTMTKAFEKMSLYLDGGLGSATDTIIDNTDSPERAAREAKRDILINKGKRLVSEFGEWLEEFDAFIDGTGWETVKSGRLNIEMMQHGPPNRQLVRACWGLFEEFRQGEQTGAKDGDFHSICRDIFELATDEDADDRLYKHVIKVHSEMQHSD